tara:strand:+ start:2244 stop:2366 length:123 start_codon:yes stop_codon:yes gene_type:complete
MFSVDQDKQLLYSAFQEVFQLMVIHVLLSEMNQEYDFKKY